MDQLREIYGGLFSEDNVLLTATHTHAGPGGFHTFWMYQAACGGFVNLTFDVTVNGIVQVHRTCTVMQDLYMYTGIVRYLGNVQELHML